MSTHLRPARPDPFAGWKAELVENIKAKIRDLRRDDCTAMGVDNLRMIVRVPNGGPVGTNAPYFYKNAWFPEALAALPRSYRSFILTD